jgi:S1-C subfamily serine protease
MEENGIRNLAREKSKCVVLICTISNSARDEELFYNSSVKKRQKKHLYKYGVTSGTSISPDGIIVTTYTGVMNADTIIVSLNGELNFQLDDENYRAEVIKLIPEFNLAFLKILPRNGEKLAYIEFGNDAALVNSHDKILKNGAVIIGKASGEVFVTPVKPANSSNKFSMIATGIEELSCKKIKGKSVLLVKNHVTGGMIPEHEGGAIVDLSGKLIGLGCYDTDSGIPSVEQYAIPISVIKQGSKIAVPSLTTTQCATKLGIHIIDSKEALPRSVKKVVGIPNKLKCQCVVVDSVELNSVADNAGIQVGDKILKFNTDMVQDAETFHNLESMAIGEQVVSLKILRKNNIVDVEINK